jgi:2-hydroxy-6-oxo-6-(2'-carboxyphenyl)-hexa-2,4-dienoate hydrolase
MAPMDDGLDRGRLRFVEADGIRTRVYEAGEGDTLVLVHGGGFGSLYSLDAWSLNLPTLATRFRVVAFDKIGQGHTGNPEDDSAYTFERLYAHAIALLEELDLGSAHLVGHSMGALLATRLVLDQPSTARTLTIVDSNTVAPDDPRYPWTRFYVELHKRVPTGPPSYETVRVEPELQSFSTEHVTGDFLDRLVEIARRPEFAHAERRVRDLRETTWMPSIEPVRASTLEEIDARGLPVPTQVVWGANDVSAPLPLGLALFERIAVHTAEADLHVLARAGHYCFRERPDAFERTLAAFCLGR